MRFEPAPPNDFADFCATYYERCRAKVPQIVAVAAKWQFEDLIPGLSDFDTRFILRHPMAAEDWRALSLAVGEVHTDMARQYPGWHRNLEHLPGLNLTEQELIDPRLYYPEFRQWTFYDGDRGLVERIQHALADRPWSSRDEIYHLGKVANYYGPYMRGIDPPVNLKQFENKYPLHSRYMHYFTPAVQAMVSLKLRRTIAGKFEALKLARDLFPFAETIDRVLESVASHYECQTDYVDPRLRFIEQELERYLCAAWGSLADCLTLVEPDHDDDRESVQQKMSVLTADPVGAFFGNTRFCRQMEGRLRFYAADVPGFDSDWLVQIELGRMINNLYRQPLHSFGLVKWNEALDAVAVLDRLRGNLLSSSEIEGFTRFATVVESSVEWPDKKRAATRVADVFPVALRVIEKVGREILEADRVAE